MSWSACRQGSQSISDQLRSEQRSQGDDQLVTSDLSHNKHSAGALGGASMQIRAHVGEIVSRVGRLKGDTLLTGALALGLGAAGAQLLGLVVTPLLSRLYSPTEMGVFTTFLAMVGMASVVGSLRYDLAIPVASSDALATWLLQLCLLLSALTAVAAAVMAPFVFSGGRNGTVMNNTTGLVLLAAAIFVTTASQALTYFTLRRRAYRTVAHAQFGQGVGRAAFQTSMGFAWPSALALIAGEMVGRTYSLWTLFSGTTRRQRSVLFHPAKKRLWHVAKRYRQFPRYSLPSAFVAVGVHQVVPLLLAHAHGVAVAGVFGLAYRVLQAPIGLLSGTLAQAYFAEATVLNSRSPEALKPFFRRTVLRLAVLWFLPALALVVAGRSIFLTLFGTQWGEAGVMASVMAPSLYFQAVVNPVSQTLLVVERQRRTFYLDALRGTAVLLALLYSAIAKLSPTLTVASYSAAMTVSYIGYLVATDRAVGRGLDRQERLALAQPREAATEASNP